MFQVHIKGCNVLVKSVLIGNPTCFLHLQKVVSSIRRMPIRYFANEVEKFKNIPKYDLSENTSCVSKEVIYVGPLSKKLQILKITTSTTSLVALFVLKNIHSRVEFPNQAVMICTLGVWLFFNFLTPFLINLFSKKYCVKIAYDHSRKEYIAEFYTYLFKKTTIIFTPEDVVLPTINKFFTVAYIKGHPLFFDVNHFKSVEFYKNIMGYDKPIEWKLDESSETLKEKEE